MVEYGLKPGCSLAYKYNDIKTGVYKYKNIYMSVQNSKTHDECHIQMFHTDVKHILKDIYTESIKVKTALDLIKLPDYSSKNMNDHYEKLFIFGCCFGFPQSSIKHFAKEITQRAYNLRSDRVFMGSRSLNQIVIVGYLEDEVCMTENSELISYFLDMANLIKKDFKSKKSKSSRKKDSWNCCCYCRRKQTKRA